VTWGTPVQSFVFLGLLVFELEPMYATSDGQTDRRTDADHRIMPPRRGHNKTNRMLALRLSIKSRPYVGLLGESQVHGESQALAVLQYK